MKKYISYKGKTYKAIDADDMQKAVELLKQALQKAKAYAHRYSDESDAQDAVRAIEKCISKIHSVYH